MQLVWLDSKEESKKVYDLMVENGKYFQYQIYITFGLLSTFFGRNVGILDFWRGYKFGWSVALGAGSDFQLISGY